MMYDLRLFPVMLAVFMLSAGVSSALDIFPPVALFDCCCGVPKNLEFYAHIIRSPANSSQTASETAILGSTNTNSNYPAGYGAVFNNKLTLAPAYDSLEIGQAKGTFFVPQGGSLVSYSSAVVFSSSFLNGSFVAVDGLFDFGKAVNDLPVFGGSEALYFSKGSQISTTVATYSGGANLVLKYLLSLEVSNLDSCSLGINI